MVTEKQAGRLPLLAEVRTRVKQEAQRALTEKRTKEATQRIVDTYKVDVLYQRPGKDLAQLDK